LTRFETWPDGQICPRIKSTNQYQQEFPLKVDGFDKMLLILILGLLAASGVLLLHNARTPVEKVNNKAMARALQTQARLLFLQNTYGPVESLISEKRWTEALLKLEELAGRYPGEAHGLLLKASVLAALGADAQAIASYAAAVRLDGTYVDRQSPFSRRAELDRQTVAGLAKFVPQNKMHADDPALRQVVHDLYYLKSRLAGGCE
jgi:hypothetical protein